MPSSKGSSQPRDKTLVFCGSCISRWILYHWPPGKPNLRPSLMVYFKGCDVRHYSLVFPCKGATLILEFSLLAVHFSGWCVLLWTCDVMIWMQLKLLKRSPTWPRLSVPLLLHEASYILAIQISLRLWVLLSEVYVAQQFSHLMPSSSHVVIRGKCHVVFPES